ncbi:MAG: hypothetical protein GX161_08265 [Firmicutes bacterium]|jgi:L-alanine-DL-glutamate epimerase-like enolase superfamily enzyme|nr:hypothetical protein [Bacillota bacterium]
MCRIAKVEMARYDYETMGEFKFLKPGPDGKVRRPSIVLRIQDDEGYVGYGQAVPLPTWAYETPETVEVTLRHYLGPALIGRDPNRIDELHQLMNTVVRPGFTVGHPMCKAAVDLACYDLVGKRRGLSASQLLGGAKRDSITLSWTVNSANMETVEAQLEEGKRKGYCNFNIKVGAPQDPEYDLKLAKLVRRFAPDGFLWADANMGYTDDTALEMAPKLADAGVDVLESPLPPNRLRGYQALKRQGALPIIMDEGVMSPVEAEEFAALGLMDGIAMKPARTAGLWGSRRIVEIMQERGLMVLGSGLTDPDLSLMGAVHLYAWAGIEHPCALNGPQFLAATLAAEASKMQIDGGVLRVPHGPGLGMEIDVSLLQFETIAEG